MKLNVQSWLWQSVVVLLGVWMLMTLQLGHRIKNDMETYPELYSLASEQYGQSVDYQASQLNLFTVTAGFGNVTTPTQDRLLRPVVNNSATYQHYYEVSQRWLVPYVKLTMLAYAGLAALLCGIILALSLKNKNNQALLQQMQSKEALER